jgi:hypothetical protein
MPPFEGSETEPLPRHIASAFAIAVHMNRFVYRESWLELERDVHNYYTRFKEAGSDALKLVDDTYDRNYEWYGQKGSPEQIAASYHETEDPIHSTKVLILLDLHRPLAEQWPYRAGTLTLPHLKGNPVIAPSLREAIDAHDRKTFKTLTIEEQVAGTARSKFTFELDRSKPIADAPPPPTA